MNTTGGFTSPVAVGDFNGDGKLDLALSNYNGQIAILLGNGDATFTPGATFSAGGGGAIAAGDFTGNGKIDLAVIDPSNNTIVFWLGNGDGTFTSSTPPLDAGSSTPDSIVAGDFNGDGRLDLAVGNTADSTVTICLGNGDGTFVNLVPIPVPTGGVFGVATADFNGDGKADLALTNYNPDCLTTTTCGVPTTTPSTVTILFGNGDGTFTAGPTTIAGLEPFHIATGDFNLDGRADLAVTNGTGNTVSILLGNGDGTFTASVPVAVLAPISIAVGDFNGDGFPDLAVPNGPGSNVSIFRNLGPFTRTTPAIIWPAPVPITYGTPLSGAQLDATSGIAGTFDYTPSVGSTPAVGTDTLTVTFMPADTLDYTAATATVALTVNPNLAPPSYTLVATPTSVTGSTVVNLMLTSTNYAGTVSFTTSVTSTNGTASNVFASAPSATLISGGYGSAKLTITADANAVNHVPKFPWQGGGAVAFGVVLLGAPFTLRKKRALAILVTVVAISLVGLSMACGSSSSGSGSTVTAAGIYTVKVTPAGTGTVTNASPVIIMVTVQ
jgi:hypothetical protein